MRAFILSSMFLFLFLVSPFGCSKPQEGIDDEVAAYESKALELYFQPGGMDRSRADIFRNVDRAIQLAPDGVRAETYMLRGHCWARMGDAEKALKDWTTAIERDPANRSMAEAYCARAIYWGKNKDYSRALEEVNRAIALNPKYAFARCVRAATYKDLGMPQQAQEELRLALDLLPSLTNVIDTNDFTIRADPGVVQ